MPTEINQPKPSASDQTQWSDTYLLTPGHHLEVGRHPGVYRILAFDPQGQPVPICRLNGVDPLGILHVGQSIMLGVRVRTFRQQLKACKPHTMRAKSSSAGDLQKYSPSNIYSSTMCWFKIRTKQLDLSVSSTKSIASDI